ncbi:MAG: hypothetical protein R3B49_00960, partial [Phycisphaerales bacterium]
MKADLTGDLNELSYHVALESDGVEHTSPFRCTLTTNARLERGMGLLVFAPEAVLHPIEMFEDPTADVDATVHVVRGPARPDGTPDDVRVSGELHLSNGSAAYRGFPYRFDDLEGTVTFNERAVQILTVRGRNANGATLQASGTFGPVGPDAEVKLKVWVEDLPIDDELRAAMSPARQRMVNALFNEERYGELVNEGLVASPDRGGARADRLRETESALAGLGTNASAGERRRLERRVAALRDSMGAEPDFEFGGLANVEVDIHRELGEVSHWTRTIQVTIPHAGMVPEHFPLPIVAENAKLIIDEREAKVVDGVFRGASGGWATIGASVELEDAAGHAVPDPVPTVDIQAHQVPIDARLLAAIPGYRSSDPGEAGTVRDVLDRLRLSGQADCEASLFPREDGSLGYTIEARVAGLSSRPATLGEDPALAVLGEPTNTALRLDDVDGVLRVDVDRIALDLTGSMSIDGESARAPASVALNAELDFIEAGTGFSKPEGVESPEHGPPRPGPALRFGVRAHGLDLETPIEHAVAVFSPSMAERAAAWRREYQPEGVVDASVELTGFVGGTLTARVEGSGVERLVWGSGEDRVEIGASRGRLVLDTGPAPWVRAEGLSAPVRFGGEDAGTVSVDGWLPLVRAGQVPRVDVPKEAALHVRVDGARFESALTRRLARDRLSDAGRSLMLEHNAAGEYGLDVRVAPATPLAIGGGAPEGELALPRVEMEGWISPRSLALDTDAGRVSFATMTGRVRFDATGGVLEQVSADTGDWHVRADGHWSAPSPGVMDAKLELDVASEVGLADDLRAIIPGPIGSVLGSLGVQSQGGLIARDVLVSYRRDPAVDHPMLDASGVVEFTGASATVGVDLAEATGSLAFSASTTRESAEPTFRLDVQADRVRAGGVRMTNASARVISGRDKGEVLAPTIEAECHGGRVAASARVRTERDGQRYWAEVVASGVRAAPVFTDLGVESTDPERQHVGDGRARGRAGGRRRSVEQRERPVARRARRQRLALRAHRHAQRPVRARDHPDPGRARRGAARAHPPHRVQQPPAARGRQARHRAGVVLRRRPDGHVRAAQRAVELGGDLRVRHHALDHARARSSVQLTGGPPDPDRLRGALGVARRADHHARARHAGRDRALDRAAQRDQADAPVSVRRRAHARGAAHGGDPRPGDDGAGARAAVGRAQRRAGVDARGVRDGGARCPPRRNAGRSAYRRCPNRRRMSVRERGTMTPEQNRVELDPPATTHPKNESAAPPEAPSQRRADDGEVQDRLADLLEMVAPGADEYDAKLVRELITASLKLIPDGRDTGELKLMAAAVKEMRYAYRVFGEYPGPHKVTIFGSARTPPDHPDYLAAVEFSRLMGERGWMSITGAGDGIMKAGHEGPGREASFGVAIRLPFETTANEFI